MAQHASSPAARLRALARLIGNTPMLGIEYTWNGRPRVVYAKAEQHNMTGSMKDRMALHIVREAYTEGRLRPGDPIVEASSGSTGIAFAAIGRALGHPVTIFMPDGVSRERTDLLTSLGANVRRSEGGVAGGILMTQDVARRNPRVFLPEQFANEANVEAHALTTGPEIWTQLHLQGRQPDAFVAGVGTGGTVMGVARALRARNPQMRIHPLQPAESPTLTTGRKSGQHRIQGLVDEFIPPIVDLASLDRVVSVHDGDAILMAQKLAAEIGVAVGISSGANVVGAVIVQDAMGGDATVVTALPDCNKKYLTTDLLREEPVRPDYIAPHVHLTGFHVLPPLCGFCDVDTPRAGETLVQG